MENVVAQLMADNAPSEITLSGKPIATRWSDVTI
jgi:hypothetical protein